MDKKIEAVPCALCEQEPETIWGHTSVQHKCDYNITTVEPIEDWNARQERIHQHLLANELQAFKTGHNRALAVLKENLTELAAAVHDNADPDDSPASLAALSTFSQVFYEIKKLEGENE